MKRKIKRHGESIQADQHLTNRNYKKRYREETKTEIDK